MSLDLGVYCPLHVIKLFTKQFTEKTEVKRVTCVGQLNNVADAAFLLKDIPAEALSK